MFYSCVLSLVTWNWIRWHPSAPSWSENAAIVRKRCVIHKSTCVCLRHSVAVLKRRDAGFDLWPALYVIMHFFTSWRTLMLYLVLHVSRNGEESFNKLLSPGAKTIKKNTNSTQNKYQTHNARAYEVTSFLSTDCELSTETCSRFVYSLGPRSWS